MNFYIFSFLSFSSLPSSLPLSPAMLMEVVMEVVVEVGAMEGVIRFGLDPSTKAQDTQSSHTLHQDPVWHFSFVWEFILTIYFLIFSRSWRCYLWWWSWWRWWWGLWRIQRIDNTSVEQMYSTLLFKQKFFYLFCSTNINKKNN